MPIADLIDAAARRVAAGYYDPDGPSLRGNGPLTGDDLIIAECKPRSPSEGRILMRPPEELLADYVRGGADAISALADPDFFDGGPELVRAAAATGLPVLWKDFVIDESQVACAAANGASTILLIERCLTPARRDELVRACHDAGLQVLLEVHADDDWRTAAGSDCDLLGVNARDLDSLAVDMERARTVVASLASRPDSVPVLALSGVKSRHDRRAARQAGAGGVLVGTSLVRAPFPDLALKALRRPLAKVCGLTDAGDAVDAAEAGADLIGAVILSPDSPRDNTSRAAADVLAAVHGPRRVLVTRSDDADAILAAIDQALPDLVQLHDPDARLAAAVRSRCPVTVAIPPDIGRTPDCDGIVIDTPRVDGTTGGAGKTHDWAIGRRLAGARPDRLSLVAGGLHSDNAAAAIEASGAWGADASSRLEASPGRKDADAVRAFVEAVHHA